MAACKGKNTTSGIFLGFRPQDVGGMPTFERFLKITIILVDISLPNSQWNVGVMEYWNNGFGIHGYVTP